MAAPRRIPPTPAEILRGRGKLGPYPSTDSSPKEARMAKISKSGGPTHAGDTRPSPHVEGPASVAGDFLPLPGIEETEPVEQPDDGAGVEGAAAGETETAAPVSEYDSWLRPALRDECDRRGLPKTGSNADLVARLVESDRKEPAVDTDDGDG